MVCTNPDKHIGQHRRAAVVSNAQEWTVWQKLHPTNLSPKPRVYNLCHPVTVTFNKIGISRLKLTGLAHISPVLENVFKVD
jgi:hypothetical protein